MVIDLKIKNKIPLFYQVSIQRNVRIIEKKISNI